MDTQFDKDAVRHGAVRENSAQTVLNKLREHENNREHTQRRWVWELLQNARDASTDEGIVARVEWEAGKLVFQHNGRDFRVEEVAHLIFHGTTKLEDKAALGQYGSGFLTTHMLSSEIDVRGRLNDGRPFSFLLRREIASAGELSDSMDEAWNDFNACIENAPTSDTAPADGFTTCFRYPLSEESAGVVAEGIEALKQSAPYVVAFNHQFRRIEIVSSEGTISFEVRNREVLQEGLDRVTVRVTQAPSHTERDYLLAMGTRASAIVPIEPTEEGTTCLSPEDIPRLFLGFPLVSTETFSSPAVINSLLFHPTENRDGIYLGQAENEANRTNQVLIDEAFDLHLRLIKFASERHFADVPALATIPPLVGKEWLNSQWACEQLSQFVNSIRQTPSIMGGDTLRAPEESVLPLAGSEDNTETLWDLLNEIRGLREGLPPRDEANGWRRAVESWLGIHPTPFDEVFSGEELVRHIESGIGDDGTPGTLEELEGLLRDREAAILWLDLLCQFLQDDNLVDVLQDSHIVLDQSGHLDRMSVLHRDTGIDSELKDIGDELLGMRIRKSLRDTRLASLASETGSGDYGDSDVVQAMKARLEEVCEDGKLDAGFAQASPRFMAWLTTRRLWSALRGYPAYSTASDGTPVLLRLHQEDPSLVEVLAPVSAWPQDIQPYAALFPRSHIVAEPFFDHIPSTDDWRALSNHGFTSHSVLVHADRPCRHFIPEGPLREDMEHRTIHDVSMTDLLHISKDKIGVMARVRDSQELARLFWTFLTEWLIRYDKGALDIQTADCECGSSHTYYPAMWLVPIIENSWVPQSQGTRDRARAQSLARLLKGRWALRNNDDALRLLKALDISELDLSVYLTADSEEAVPVLRETLNTILVSAGDRLGDVHTIIKAMQADPDLLSHLEDRNKSIERINENRRIGRLVEDLVREGLKAEGFRVKRTGTGSDFEIDVMSMELRRKNRTWLVEVKASREEKVRMSERQAEEAVKCGAGFLLCVVPLEHGVEPQSHHVRAGMRFVQNIGSRIGPLYERLGRFNEQHNVATTIDDPDIQLEIGSGTPRIGISNSVWEDGTHLDHLSDQLTSGGT